MEKCIISYWSIYFVWKISGNSYFTYDCVLPVGMSWLWTNIIWASSMLLEGNVNNLCSVFYLSYLKHWKFLIHTKIDHDLSLCRNLTHGRFGKFRVTGRKLHTVWCQYLSYKEKFEVPFLHKNACNLSM